MDTRVGKERELTKDTIGKLYVYYRNFHMVVLDDHSSLLPVCVSTHDLKVSPRVVLGISILVVYFSSISLTDMTFLDHEPSCLVPVRSMLDLLRFGVVFLVFLLVVTGHLNCSIDLP